MRIKFLSQYTCATDGINITTFNEGDQVDVRPGTMMESIAEAVLSRGQAIEIKPDAAKLETTGDSAPAPARVVRPRRAR